MSTPATVTVHLGDDADSVAVGTAELVLDRAILLDPALAASLLPEHDAFARMEHPVWAQVAGVPLTVRIVSADGALDEVRHTDGALHVCGAPGAAPLVAASFDTPSGGAPTATTDLPAGLRAPLVVLGSVVAGLPRGGAAVTGWAPDDGLPDLGLDEDGPPEQAPPFCYVFFWLPPC